MANEGFKRKLTAILSADAVGYSRLMEENEEATIQTLNAYRNSMSTLIEQHRGRVVDMTGDNLLAEFSSVVDAVKCAVETQKEMSARNAALPENRRMLFRIGVNLGDIVEEDDRIYGDGVNIAARLEALAEAGGICISRTAYGQVKNKLDLGYEYIGEHSVKNISEPVHVYRVLMEPEAAGKVIGEKRKEKRRLTLAAVIVLIIGVGGIAGWYLYTEQTKRIEPASEKKMAFPLPVKPSIAVLPFVNMSGDSEQEYIADGLTENIITGLSQIPEMFVIARNSVFTYKGKPVKVKQVSEELGVKYVLEGSVQKEGNRLRVNAQLIDALKGHHLWAERYDRELKGLFALQDEITMNVLTAMEVKLTRGESARLYRTDSFEAWGYFVKGYSLFEHYTKEDNAKARKLFERALKIDPNYAFAMAFLAWSHFIEVRFGWSESPGESIKKALEIAQKTLALDENQPAVHSLLNTIYMIQMEHDKAIAEGKRAIELGPNDALAQVLLAQTMRYAGRFEEAASLSEKALRLQPYYPVWFLSNLGISYYYVGKYEEAVDITKQYLQLAENLRENEPLYQLHLVLAMNYVRLDRLEDARDHAAKALRLFPGFSLEYDRTVSFYSNPAHLEQQHIDLRKAGIPEHPPLKLPDKPSIAVLAFDNLSGDPEQEYFSDGIAENIITTLSQLDELFVIARNSSFIYKDKPVKVQQISRELGVRYVLEGSVQKSGDRVRITAQLIDAKNGQHLWAERYDREFKDIFEIQDDITIKIVTALRIELTEGEQIRLAPAHIKNPDAFLKSLKALSHWRKGTKESLRRFGQGAQEIIDIEPESPIGYRWLGWYHKSLADRGISPRENIIKAFKLAQKALSMDKSDGYSHALLGNIYVLMRKYEKAIESGKRSVDLQPNGAMVYAAFGSTLNYAGRADEAITHLKHAIRLSPFPPYYYYYNLGLSYRQKGKYEDALTEFKKALQRAPDAGWIQASLAITYILADREDEAQASTAKALELDPKISVKRTSKILKYKNQAHSKLILDAMRKAGFPE